MVAVAIDFKDSVEKENAQYTIELNAISGITGELTYKKTPKKIYEFDTEHNRKILKDYIKDKTDKGLQIYKMY